jgi:hypothetical protein
MVQESGIQPSGSEQGAMVDSCKYSIVLCLQIQQQIDNFSNSQTDTGLLTLSAQHPFQNFSTPCILNVNNTGAKQCSIMK